MPPDPDRVRDLFLSAAALPAVERAAYLDGRCADPDLREAVERLLAAHDKSPPSPPAGSSVPQGHATRARQWPTGAWPLLILGPLCVVVFLLAFFSDPGVPLTLLMGLSLFIVGIARVGGLFKKEGLIDELDGPPRRLDPAPGSLWLGMLLVFQFFYAFKRPRVFACWVVLQMFGFALMIGGITRVAIIAPSLFRDGLRAVRF
jgi:hypothetical protein